jgi:hypothetical protein
MGQSTSSVQFSSVQFSSVQFSSVQFREHGLTCQTTSAMEEVDSVSTTTFCPGCRVTGGARFLVLRSFFFFRTFVMRAGPRFFFPVDHTTKQAVLNRNYLNTGITEI